MQQRNDPRAARNHSQVALDCLVDATKIQSVREIFQWAVRQLNHIGREERALARAAALAPMEVDREEGEPVRRRLDFRDL